jgi:hypothetical protein
VITFWKAYNLNGPAYTISGRAWQAGNAANGVTTVNATALCNQSITLNPSASGNRAQMIRCSYNSNGVNDMTISIANVPNGLYNVYVTVWEDNTPSTTFWMSLQGGQVYVANTTTGAAGWWQRKGPYIVNVTNGAFSIAAGGGFANLSGIELWTRTP